MAARSPRRREGSAWLRAAIVYCFCTLGLTGLAAPAVAQLDSPAAIQVAPGCQQYTVTWHAVAGAAAYRVYVTGESTPIEVVTESAVIPVTSAPTDRTFRVATVDANDIEGPHSGPRQGTGASLPFALQPLPDITVHVGDVLSFMVSLVGQPGVPAPLTSYEWTRDGVAFIDPSSTYFTSTAQLSDGGLYHLRGCTECCDELDVVRVTVLPNALPPPQNVASQPGCLGATVTWDARLGAASYLVHRSGTTDVSVLTNSYFDPLAVGVCRSYSVSTVDAFNQTGGASGSTPQRCGVAPLPSPLSLGPDQFIRNGSPYTITVPGTFDLSSTTFSWRKNNVPISAPNQPTFSIAVTATTNSGSYTCAVTNACGTVTTLATQLTVVIPPAQVHGEVAAITGCGQVTVQWNPVAGALQYLLDRTPSFPGQLLPPPALQGIVVPGSPYVDNVGAGPTNESFTYRVRAMGLGDITGGPSANTIAVSPRALPTVISNPAVRTLEVGAFYAFHVSVSPITATVTWRKNGIPIAGGQQHVGVDHIVMDLPFLGVTLADAGVYDVQACTPCGCLVSASLTLNVCATPAISMPPQVLASEGQPTVDIVATVTNATSVRWYKSGVALDESVHLTGTTANTLTIHTPLVEDAGFYELRAVGTCATVAGPQIELKIDPCVALPLISEQPAPTQAVLVGAPATLTFTTTCCRPPRYQWYRFVGNSIVTPILGATSGVLTIPSFSPGDVGTYFCTAENFGTVFSNFVMLTEQIPPPPPQFTRFGNYKLCDGANIVWSTNVPLAMTLVVRRGSCTAPVELTVPPAGLVTNGSVLLPILDPSIRCVTLEGRDASSALVLSGNMYAWARPRGAALSVSVVVQPNYVTMPFGTAIALQVGVSNSGCDAYAGDLTLSGVELAQLGAPAVFGDGSPAAGTALLPSGLAPNQTRWFPLIYFPVTPPGGGTTITRELTIAVEFTDPQVGLLSSLSTIQFTPAGVR